MRRSQIHECCTLSGSQSKLPVRCSCFSQVSILASQWFHIRVVVSLASILPSATLGAAPQRANLFASSCKNTMFCFFCSLSLSSSRWSCVSLSVWRKVYCYVDPEHTACRKILLGQVSLLLLVFIFICFSFFFHFFLVWFVAPVSWLHCAFWGY